MKSPLWHTLAALVCAAQVTWAEEAPASASGWITLFDGTSLAALQNARGGPPHNWEIRDGALFRARNGGDIWTKETFGDFVLELEFKTEGNSGIFLRTADPADNVQTGIEVQVLPPGNPGKHSVGAFYDLQAPTQVTAKDGWNKVVITARGPQLTVEINGKVINEIDLDRWTEAGKNPDGSKNKFQRALKDFKREGLIGLQDHNDPVWYRHIRIKRL